MSFEQGNEIPFENLKNSKFASEGSMFAQEKLKEIDGVPYIIRERSYGEQNSDEIIKELQEFKKGLSRLEEHHINIPPVEIVIGKNERGENTAFIMTKIVEGIALKNFEHLSLELQQELFPKIETTYQNLIFYIKDSLKEQKPFLYDSCRIDQFVYGTVADEDSEEKKMYMVDTDPLFARAYYSGFSFLAGIARSVQDIERMAGKPMLEVRELLNSCIKEYSSFEEMSIDGDSFENDLNYQEYRTFKNDVSNFQ